MMDYKSTPVFMLFSAPNQHHFQTNNDFDTASKVMDYKQPPIIIRFSVSNQPLIYKNDDFATLSLLLDYTLILVSTLLLAPLQHHVQ